MPIILGRRGFSMMSARALARAFRKDGRKLYASSNPNKNTVVNWGNSSCIKGINQNIITNKFEQLAKLKEAGIRCLEIYRHAPEDPAVYPIFCRQREHQAGNDIVIARTPEEIVPAYFYTKYERFVRELRVHSFLLGEPSFRAFLKERAEEDEYPIRNLKHEYGFRLVGLSQPLKDFLVEVGKVLEMDFFCADVGVLEGKEYCVIEVNSAPSLVNNQNSLSWFKNNLGKILFEDWK